MQKWHVHMAADAIERVEVIFTPDGKVSRVVAAESGEVRHEYNPPRDSPPPCLHETAQEALDD